MKLPTESMAAIDVLSAGDELRNRLAAPLRVVVIAASLIGALPSSALAAR